jgi:hypothetical protein
MLHRYLLCSHEAIIPLMLLPTRGNRMPVKTGTLLCSRTFIRSTGSSWADAGCTCWLVTERLGHFPTQCDGTRTRRKYCTSKAVSSSTTNCRTCCCWTSLHQNVLSYLSTHHLQKQVRTKYIAISLSSSKRA